jgi:hypothetical protein
MLGVLHDRVDVVAGDEEEKDAFSSAISHHQQDGHSSGY